MALEFKPDFEAARRRWDAFWRGERPAVAVTTAKEGCEPAPRPRSYELLTGDTDAHADKVIRWAASHEFIGEAIPFCQVDFAPDDLAALLGAELKAAGDPPETVWVQPCVEDWDDADIRFRREGPVWRRMVECAEGLRRRLDGRVLVTLPTLQGGLDCLSALRGPEKLLMDLVTVPDRVSAALARVSAAYAEVLDAFCELLDVRRFGSITRHGAYSTGRTNVPQCDFSCMISPEMFRRFALPSIAHEAALLDAATYHLDGPDAIRHLEAVCEVDDIGIIQWQPGAAAAGQDWSALRRRIDALGKGQLIWTDAAEARRWARELASPRLYLGCGASSRREAESLIADIEGLRL
jgi:5-methyltetrahydrofolate--homocysteine methyltransferase